MKIIAYMTEDNYCALVYGASKEMKRLGMSEDSFLQHVREKNKIQDIPCLYVSKEELPDKKYRASWVIDHNQKKIVIDQEKKIDIEARMLAEEETEKKKKEEFDSLVERKKQEILEKN